MPTNELTVAQRAFLRLVAETPPAGLRAVYSFPRPSGRPGLVRIYNREPTPADATAMLGLYFQLQDELCWPHGVKFLGDQAARYLRSSDSLWENDPWGEYALLPDDLRAAALSLRPAWGAGLHLTPPPTLAGELPALPFSRQDLLATADRHPELMAPFLDARGHWRRQEMILSRPRLLSVFRRVLADWRAGRAVDHLHLYGRLWGSGKTQTMYEWMRVCIQQRVPFIYRMWAAKDSSGAILEDSDHLNEPAAVTDWIRARSPGKPFVLFLDEVDLDPAEFPECLVVSGGKTMPLFPPRSPARWRILDMLRDYPLSAREERDLLRRILESSSATRSLLDDEMVAEVVRHTHIRGFRTLKPVPLLIRALAYTLMFSILRGGPVGPIKRQDLLNGIRMASCPWMVHYGKTHDVHCEFFVHDGRDYTEIDPHNPSFVP